MNILQELHGILVHNNKVVYWNTGKTELNIRCPYCRDSTKDKTHAHLYISIKEPYAFYCQRCETSGVLSGNFLNDIEVENSELSITIESSLKKFMKNTNKTNKSIEIYENLKNLKLPKYNLEGNFKPKLNYLNNRLGIDLVKQDLMSFKVINSLEELIILNKLDYLLDNDKFYRMMVNVDKNAVGFISSDNNYVTFRFINSTNKLRYLHLSLNYPYDIGYKFFSIKKQVSLLEPVLKVKLTEGPLDLISVYKNFYIPNTTDTLFVAVNGKGFNLIPKLLNRMGFLNLDMQIYSDMDVKKNFYLDRIDLFRLEKFLLTYNIFEGEKDFGVVKEKIVPKTIRLL